MQPCATKLTVSVKDVVPSHDVIEVSSSDSSENDENTPSCADSQKQLVLYNSSPVNNVGEIEVVPEPFSHTPLSSQRVLPSIGAFTVQCANCFKWRLIPNNEKYQEIREHITEKPFVCENALEWRNDVSCDDPADIEQDGSRLWAIDKPNIAQPPPGWQRLLRIRGEGSSKFADIYYTAPTGKQLRSIPDVEKFLYKHPEYMEQGVTTAQFSFTTPKPLQEDYVKKRSSRVPALQDGNHMGMLQAPEISPGEPMALLDRCAFNPVYPPVKKARSAPAKRIHNFDLMFRHPNM